MEIYKTYKFRMYPSDSIKKKLDSFLGTTRFIYNYYLNAKEKNNNLKFSDMKKDLKRLQEENTWLKDIDGSILRTAIDNLERGYERYYNKLSKKPKFKKYSSNQIYRTPCLRGEYKGKKYQTIKLDLERRVIKLPKLDEIEIKGYKKLTKLDCNIINATVKRIAHKYYLYLLVSEEINLPKFCPNYIVGLDLGVKDLVITSNGEKFKKLDFKREERKLKGLNKWLSRSQIGSKNRLKIINKIEVVNEKIKNMRKFYNHLITNKILEANDIVAIETLKVKEMIEKGKNHLAKFIVNSNLSELIKILKYKSKWQNKRIYEIDTYYPSSQICSHCKRRNRELKDLNIRSWECKECHFVNDRDINASINILDEGMKLYLKDLRCELKAS